MPRVPWPPVLLLGLLLLGWLLQRAMPIGDEPSAATRAVTRTVGWSLVTAAALVEIAAALRFRRAGTTVLPHRDADRLVTGGMHARSRNPIYVAHVTVAVGLALATWNPWLVASAGLLGLLLHHLAVLPEERFLTERFGDEYAEYRSRVRRWL